MMHSFLLVGQSNMAGRGFPQEVEPIPKKQGIYVLRNGLWRPMFVPVNPDRATSGTCLAESFAYAYVKSHPGVSVGLIPCADGGTRAEQWAPGELLYDHAIAQAKLAMRTSDLRGILWHQGESDALEERYSLYQEQCSRILHSMREDLELPDLPILVGGLGDYLKQERPHYADINNALRAIADADSKMAFVSAEGLTSNPDMLHFNAPSLRKFGLRYFAEFEKLDDAPWIVPEEQTDYETQISDIERL